MEAPVAERRAWPVDDVLAEYETYSGQVADLGASLQDPPMSETMLPMGDLGTHPMSIMPSTFLFDGYCHLRNDILKPNGPIDRPEPPRDEKRLAPTIEWMLAGLPWMCTEQLAFVDRPITLVITGVGGGTWTIGPGGDDGRVLVSEGRGRRLGRNGDHRRARLRHLGNEAAPVARPRADRGRRRLRRARARRHQDHLTSEPRSRLDTGGPGARAGAARRTGRTSTACAASPSTSSSRSTPGSAGSRAASSASTSSSCSRATW